MILTGTVDTMMLASVSDAAVGAVGTANSYLSIFIIMLAVISSGLVSVVTQYIGAERRTAAGQTLQLGLCFNALLGILLSLVLYFGSGLILRYGGIAPLLLEDASIYLKIVGGCSFLNAFISVYSGYLRSFGLTRQSLNASLAANGVNLVLNAVFLYIWHWGVAGVALATVLSRVMNLVAVAAVAYLKIDTRDASPRVPPQEILGQILRIGLPAAFETGLYNFAVALTIRYLNQMDSLGINVTARSYAQQLGNICFCGAAALSQANGLITGWLVGSGAFRECTRRTNTAAWIAIATGVSSAALFAFLGRPILHLFTDDPVLIELTVKLLFIDIVLEIGRSSNMVFGQALKVSGDALYPTIIGAVFMYLCMVGGTWFFGIHLGLNAVGAYLAMALDECVRAVFLRCRWRSEKWQSKGILYRKETTA